MLLTNGKVKENSTKLDCQAFIIKYNISEQLISYNTDRLIMRPVYFRRFNLLRGI